MDHYWCLQLALFGATWTVWSLVTYFPCYRLLRSRVPVLLYLFNFCLFVLFQTGSYVSQAGLGTHCVAKNSIEFGERLSSPPGAAVVGLWHHTWLEGLSPLVLTGSLTAPLSCPRSFLIASGSVANLGTQVKNPQIIPVFLCLVLSTVGWIFSYQLI